MDATRDAKLEHIDEHVYKSIDEFARELRIG
jgi:hypothetical protein